MSFKHRLLIVISLLVVAVSTVLVLAGEAGKIRIERSLAEPVNVGKAYAWQMAVEEHLVRMKEQASHLEMAYEIKTALKKGDMAALTSHANTFFNLMKDQQVFTSLQIVDHTGTIRYAAPEKVSGKARQKTVALALDSQEYASGLELDSARNIVLSLSIPFKSRKKIYGVGVYNLSMAPIVAAVSQKDGSDMFVLSPEGKVHAGTNPSLFSELRPNLPELGRIDLFSAKTHAATFSVAIQPLLDMTQTPIAHLVSVRDMTALSDKNRKAEMMLLGIMACSVVLALVCLGLYIQRAFKPLESAVTMIAKIADGDFTQTFKSRRNDEIGLLLGALNKMAINLRRIFGHIAHSGKDISIGASSQAASLEETSAALEQMAAMTKENAENANLGTHRIAEAHQSMIAAEKSMGQVSITMLEISEASQKIQDIIDAIRDIAFNTNLLSLNASVEAARAGEAGAGFSVVADEVRQLALRSAKSANSITDLIETTVHKIQRHEQLTEDAGGLFKKALHDVIEVKALIEEIVQSSDEQSRGIGDINTSVARINEVVQENATHSERMMADLKKFRFQSTGDVPALIN